MYLCLWAKVARAIDRAMFGSLDQSSDCCLRLAQESFSTCADLPLHPLFCEKKKGIRLRLEQDGSFTFADIPLSSFSFMRRKGISFDRNILIWAYAMPERANDEA